MISLTPRAASKVAFTGPVSDIKRARALDEVRVGLRENWEREGEGQRGLLLLMTSRDNRCPGVGVRADHTGSLIILS